MSFFYCLRRGVFFLGMAFLCASFSPSLASPPASLVSQEVERAPVMEEKVSFNSLHFMKTAGKGLFLGSLGCIGLWGIVSEVGGLSSPYRCPEEIACATAVILGTGFLKLEDDQYPFLFQLFRLIKGRITGEKVMDFVQKEVPFQDGTLKYTVAEEATFKKLYESMATSALHAAYREAIRYVIVRLLPPKPEKPENETHFMRSFRETIGVLYPHTATYGGKIAAGIMTNLAFKQLERLCI
jgi:hypothetical protein